MMKIRRRLALCLSVMMFAAQFIMMYPAFSLTGYAADSPKVYAESYVLLDADTGEVLAEKNAHMNVEIGSFASLVSVMVAIDLGVNLDAPLGFEEDTLAMVPENETMLLPREGVGEVMSVRESMYGMTMGGSKACAYQLANTLTNHDLPTYLNLMNQKVQSFGAVETVLADVAGVTTEAESGTNVCDMVNIFVNALGYADAAGMLEEEGALIAGNAVNPERTLVASSDFISGRETLEGIRYGFRSVCEGETVALVSYVEREEGRLIAVTAYSAENMIYSDSATLVEYGYAVRRGEVSPYTYTFHEEEVYANLNSVTELYASDYEGADIVASLKDGAICRVFGTWEDWSWIGLSDGVEGFVKSDRLEATEDNFDTNPADSPYADAGNNEAESGESEPESMTPEPEDGSQEDSQNQGVANNPVNQTQMNEGVKAQVLAAQMKQKQKQRTMTYIALAGVFMSVIGLVVLNRK